MSIYPETPKIFGEANSQAIMGIQMASAYIGTTFMTPLFGIVAEKININLYPWYLIIFIFYRNTYAVLICRNFFTGNCIN